MGELVRWERLALCMTVVFAAVAWGQTNKGAISGSVSDPSGALIGGADVIAKNKDTAAEYKSRTTESGIYTIESVPAGTYDLTVSKDGFTTSRLSGVPVEVNTTTSRDANLAVGNIGEVIEVVADAPTVQADTSDVGTVVQTRQVEELPLVLGGVGAMRSVENFVFLTPGAIGPGTAGGAGGVFESKLNGGQNYATEILLDGVSVTRSENGSSFDETAPSVDALGEFKVLTSNLPAEYGRTTGGIESFGLRSGSNSFHGSVYEIAKRTGLDANTWFNNGNLALQPTNKAFKRPVDNQNDYGLTFGGPVWIPKLYNGKNRTFFFFAWENFKKTQSGSRTSTVPIQAYLNGDFSSLLGAPTGGINPCTGQPNLQGQIFDPATTTTVGGVQCRMPFLNNQIPANRFSAVANNLIPLFPVPNGPGAQNNFFLSEPFPISNTATSVRIDEILTGKQKLGFSYASRENFRLSDNPTFPVPVVNCCQVQDFFTHYIRVQHDYTISNSVLNSLVLGYNRTNSFNQIQTYALGKNWDQILGITGLPAPSSGFPSFTFGDSGITDVGSGTNNDTIDNGLRLSNTTSWVKGKHSWKFGVNWAHQQYSPGNSNNDAGTLNFSRQQTASDQNDQSLTGNAFASFLLGEVHDGGYQYRPKQVRFGTSYLAFFGQDDYKVTPNLVLNLGLRWDMESTRKEALDQQSGFDPNLPNPGAGNLPGALAFLGSGAGRNNKHTFVPSYKKDWGPRVGFAYSPHFESGAMNKIVGAPGTTVIRGGYGIYYGALIYAEFGGDLQQGFSIAPSFSTTDNFSPGFALDSGFPAFPTTLPIIDPTLLNGQGIQWLRPDSRPAMTQNWTLEVQHELAKDLILDVGYVGTHGTRLRSDLASNNYLNPKFFTLGSTVLNADINSPTAAAAGIAPPYAGFSGNVAQALRPFPQYQRIFSDADLESLGQSTFNALEASVRRRFRNGLNLMASYTFSKTLTDADSALPVFANFAGGGSKQNPYNLRGEKALSNQDTPHTLVLSYLYELPAGRGKKFLNKGGIVNEIVGGWQIAGIHRYQSGQNLSFGCASGIPAFDACIRFDQVLPTVFSSAVQDGSFNPFTDTYFNSAAFSDPNSPSNLAARGGAFAFGTQSRTTNFRMRPFKNEDFSIIKKFALTESQTFEIRADLLNAFNRHVFNRPDTGGPFTNGNFGVITDTVDAPRQIQLKLRYAF